MQNLPSAFAQNCQTPLWASYSHFTSDVAQSPPPISSAVPPQLSSFTLSPSTPSTLGRASTRSPLSLAGTHIRAASLDSFLPSAQLQLYQPASPAQVDGSSISPEDLVWDNAGADGRLRVHCPRCSILVGTGSTTQRLTGNLIKHMNGSRCKPFLPVTSELQRARDFRHALFPRHIDGTFRRPNTHSAPSTPISTPLSFEISTPSSYEDHTYMNIESSDTEMEFGDDYTSTPHDRHDRENMPPTTSAFSFLHPQRPCPGVPLIWKGSNVWNQYPFHRHSSSFSQRLGYDFCGIDKTRPGGFQLRADHCTGNAMLDGSPCNLCQAVTPAVEHLSKISENTDQCTNQKYLSREQLCGRVVDAEKTKNNWKLKFLNMGRKCATSMRKLDDSRRFLMATATGDVPRLQQLIRQGLKAGAGIAALTNRIEQALADTYRARSYTSTDLDISVMVLRLGGRKLLYALNKHISIPSLRTLRRACAFIQLTPSVGMPKLEDALANIKSIFLPKTTSLDADYRTGMSILWDEISQEETACYIERLDCVGGLCREHSDTVVVRLSTFEHAVSIARALVNGTVHYGKETSVIALSSFSRNLRGAFPVIISPTCKKETPQESAALLEKVIAAWNQSDFGAKYFGPVWTFASDGDAGRRAMLYSLFVKHAVDTRHQLYKYLGGLPGLNLFVGDHDITGDFDWKHELKRIARLMRTAEGMVVKRTVVNFDTLRRHLCRNPALTSENVELLMKPEDSQDVPRAIDFINAVSSIGALSVDGCDPGEMQDVTVISVIGEMFAAFMTPFIEPHWNLSDQVTSLSKYSHMAFALFRETRVNFMPYQLYGDTQTTVKNIIFCIAKQQDLDGTQPFYLFLTGDDRLENLFGLSRMQGGHSPNFNYKQFVERLGAAMDLDKAFGCNPHLFSGHRRLKVTRTEKADHLNPESWTGNVVANSVDLSSSWLEGRQQALDTLKKLDLSPKFDELFDEDRVLDLLKPFGDGKYPGVSTDADRSLEPTATPAPGLEDSFLYDEASHEIFLGESIDASAEFPPQSVLTVPPAPSDTITNASTSNVLIDDTLVDDVLTLEEHLDDVDDDDTRPSAWLEHLGTKIHKSSICRLVITPDYVRKSHERPLRVRGFTSDIKKRNYSSTDVIDANMFLVGDVFATLVVTGSVVALAILKCIAIEEKGTRVDRVHLQSLPHAAAGIKLTGQILDMRMVPAEAVDREPDSDITSNSSDPFQEHPRSADDWIWNGSFIKLDLDQKISSPIGKAARKTIALKLTSVACTPVNPRIIKAGHRLGSSECPELNSAGLTWVFSTDEMEFLKTRLWCMVKASPGSLRLLPSFRMNISFPYNLPDNHRLISEEGTYELEGQKVDKPLRFRCYLCRAEMEAKKAWQHVSKHLLKAMRGVPDNDVNGNLITDIGSMPCGYCGRSGDAMCGQVSLTKGPRPQAQSECRHAHRFLYAPSLISTESTPCTNVPIKCTIPGCTGSVGSNVTAIWKYNMPEHIRTAHPGYSWNGIDEGAVLPADLTRAMHITVEEEKRVGIPEDKIPRKPSLPHEVSTASKRGASSQSGGRPPKKRKP